MADKLIKERIIMVLANSLNMMPSGQKDKNSIIFDKITVGSPFPSQAL